MGALQEAERKGRISSTHALALLPGPESSPMITSIIIPCHNHAAYLSAAIDSALAQTAEVEVIVVDDGSTDETPAVLASYGDRVRAITIPHSGPALARNAGIDAARGEFVQFLDADDTIEPTKIELQLRHLDADAGWVLCDTRIIGVDGKEELASERYDYRHKRLDGWLEPWLAVANFIPIHAPLVRRSALGTIRFPLDKEPEDWHFWWALSREARCRYTPAILATYTKRRGGRSSQRRTGRACRPGQPSPLLLNLGCGNPDARSWHPMPYCVNLDKSLGWRFEDGLGEFADGSVDGITVSHALMYVEESIWPSVLGEFARVLRPGGVLRITEDDTTHPQSSRLNGWKGSDPAVTLTDAAMARRHLESVGFSVHDVREDETYYRDHSLRQAQHGAVPDVFFIEGIRECSVLLSPHADDEALFGAFLILRHRPHVVICYPSGGDYGSTEERFAESRAAVSILGGAGVEQWDGDDIETKMRALDARLRPTLIFAPNIDASHPEHRAVAAAAAVVFGGRVRWFHTYDDMGKVRRGTPTPHEPGWAERKREALACYRTQIEHPRARKFFEDFDLAEYTL